MKKLLFDTNEENNNKSRTIGFVSFTLKERKKNDTSVNNRILLLTNYVYSK